MLRALTLDPEWAYAVLHLGKRVENRERSPKFYGLAPGDYFCLHAGMKKPTPDRIFGLYWMASKAGLAVRTVRGLMLVTMPGKEHALLADSFPLGTILAVCKLGVARYCFEEPWARGDQWGWQLAEVLPLPEPVQCKGKQGGWFLTKEQETMVRGQLPDLP